MNTFPSISHLFQNKSCILFILLALLLAACNSTSVKTSSPQKLSCATIPASSNSTTALATLSLPGQPFGSVVTQNGQWIFVSLSSNNADANGVAVLHLKGAQVCLLRIIPFLGSPLGLALTHDDSLLIVTNDLSVVFVDSARAESGAKGAVLGIFQESGTPIAIEIAVSKDDQYGFVANENYGTVNVINLKRIRQHDFGSDVLVGQVQVNQGPLNVDSGPVGMAFSPDNRYLYVTSRIDTGDPSPQGNICRGFPQGTLSVVDVSRAEHDPAHAVIAHAFADCGPVRVVLTSSGDIAWVTAQTSDKLLAFSTSKLLTDPSHALLASTSVDNAPTGVALVDNDAIIVVTNSNRFIEPQLPQTITLLDTKKVLAGGSAFLGTIKVGAFPRELTPGPDKQTLFLTNFNSGTLNIINVKALPHPST